MISSEIARYRKKLNYDRREVLKWLEVLRSSAVGQTEYIIKEQRRPDQESMLGIFESYRRAVNNYNVTEMILNYLKDREQEETK